MTIRLPRPYRLQCMPTNRILPPRGERYHRFAPRETCLLRDESWITWLVANGTRGFIDLPNDRIYDYYVEENSYRRLLKRLERNMMDRWRAHLAAYPVRSRGLLQAAGALSAAAEAGHTVALPRLLDRLWKAQMLFGDYIHGAWAVIYHTEPELARAFPTQMDLITSLDRPIQYQLLLRDLRRFPTQKLIQRYGWLKMYNPYDSQYDASDLGVLKTRSSFVKVNKQLMQLPRARRAFAQFLRSVHDKELYRKAELVHTYAFLKTDRIDVWRQSMLALKPFLEYLAERWGCTIREVSNAATREIRNWFSYRVIPDRASLRKRAKNQALYYFSNGHIEITTDIHRIKDSRKRIFAAEQVIKEILGITACPGIARGRVKIIGHSEDLSKVMTNDIFVAKYTFPSYTLAMQKCAAVVTDEGGLTSHAAVVAREFRIPCIVGTQVASRVLRDGDRVEVDATKGIVRKI